MLIQEEEILEKIVEVTKVFQLDKYLLGSTNAVCNKHLQYMLYPLKLVTRDVKEACLRKRFGSKNSVCSPNSCIFC